MANLMSRLGYASNTEGNVREPQSYIVSGGDWGADIAAHMAHTLSPGLQGIHLTSTFFNVSKELHRTEVESNPRNPAEKPTLAEQTAIRLDALWKTREDGYFQQMATRPQTLGYSLANSPVGLLAWILEKLVVWTDAGVLDHTNPHSPGSTAGIEQQIPFDVHEIIDLVMLYWVTNTGASSARMYFDSKEDDTAVRIQGSVAVGVSLFENDVNWAERKWAGRYYERLVQWNEVDEGGHFAAWEVPEIFVREVRQFASVI